MKSQMVEGLSIFLPDNAVVLEALKNDYLYIRFETDDMKSPDLARNVWKFDLSGNLIWKIEAVKTETIKPFSSIEFREDDLIAYNRIGVEYLVDQKTGKLMPSKSPGRPW